MPDTTTASPPATNLPTLSAKVPQSMVNGVAKETSRYAINAVHVFAGPTGYGYASVTCGRTATVREIEATGDGPSASVLVPIGLLKGKPASVHQGIAAGHGFSMIDLTGGALRNLTTQTFGDPAEGSFPPVVDVMPEWTDDHHVVGIDPALLMNVCKSMGADKVTLALPKNPGKPIIVLGSKDGALMEGAFGVVMPVTITEGCREMFKERLARYARAFQNQWDPVPEVPEPAEVKMVPLIGGGAPAEEEAPASPPSKPGVVPDEELVHQAECEDERGFLGRLLDDLADMIAAGDTAKQAAHDNVAVWLKCVEEGTNNPQTCPWTQSAEFEVPVVEDDGKVGVISAVYLAYTTPPRFEFRGPISPTGFLSATVCVQPPGRTMVEHAMVVAKEGRQTFVNDRAILARKRPRKEAPPTPVAKQRPAAPPPPPPKPVAVPDSVKALIAKYGGAAPALVG